MIKKLNNNKGSALVWVLVICLIFGVLGIAIGWIALSMNNRSIENNNLNQAYFTARSGADAIFSQLNGYVGAKDDIKIDSNTLYADLYKNMVYGSKQKNKDYAVKYNNIFDESIGSSGNNQMGGCSVEGVKTKGHVKFTSTATVNNSTETVILEAYQEARSIVWPAKEWASPLPTPDINKEICVGQNSSITNETSKKNIENGIMDVAVYTLAGSKDQDLGTEGVLTISRDTVDTTIGKNQNLEKRAVFIYLEEYATLKLTGMNYALFDGTLKLKQDSAVPDKWFEDDKGYTVQDWENYYGPDIFIYMENNSKIIFDKPNKDGAGKIVPYPLYIACYGNTTNLGKIETTQNKDIQIYWTQDAVVELYNGSNEWLKDNKGKSFEKENLISPDRKTLSGYKQAGHPYAYSSETEKKLNTEENGEKSYAGYLENYWQIVKYEREKVQ